MKTTSEKLPIVTGSSVDQSGPAITQWDGKLPPSMTESAIRRRALTRGYRLVKFNERSKWYPQYGPYALKNENNFLEAHGLSLAEAADYLDKATE